MRFCWSSLSKYGYLDLRRSKSDRLLAVLLCEIFILSSGFRQRHVPPARNLGNGPEALKLLPAPDGNADFSFAVVGDVNAGMATFEDILGRLRKEPVAFTLLLGDVVAHAYPDDHQAFRAEMARIWPGMPTFTVAGNHDEDARNPLP